MLQPGICNLAGQTLTVMKSAFFVLPLLLTLQTSAQKVLFVIADGIPADIIESVRTPALDSIAHEGFYLRAHVGGDKDTYNQTPTISAVGYNSLLTGTWVNKHNVWGNDIKAPNYHYPTLFRLLKTSFPEKKTAIYSSWLDNRTKLVGDGLEATGYLAVDYHADGFESDTALFPHDPHSDYMHHIDDTVARLAADGIRLHGPDLTWVYLEYTDDMGHAHGDSPEMNRAVGYLDSQLSLLWQAVQYRQRKFGEDWMVIITTDHGRDARSGRNHGGQSTRERTTWIVSSKPSNIYGRYDEPAIVDIMPGIARFLKLDIPVSLERELDGIPLWGPVSIAHPRLQVIGSRIDLSWQVLDSTGLAHIYMARTNDFKNGGQDDYQEIASVPVSRGHCTAVLPAAPDGFFKIVIQAPHNMVNRWWPETMPAIRKAE